MSQPSIGAQGAVPQAQAIAHGVSGAAQHYVYVTNEIHDGSGWASSVTMYHLAQSGNVPPAVVIQGSQTQLTSVNGLVVDREGEIYVADSDTNEIVEFAPSAAGNSAPNRIIAGSNTLLQTPVGLALDTRDNLYVGVCGSTCHSSSAPPAVLEFRRNSKGNVAPIRDITGSDTGLVDANDPAIAPNGEIYVTNWRSSSIDVFSADANGDATPVRVISGQNTGLDYPDGIAVDSHGLYAGSSGKDDLARFASSADGNATPAAVIAGSKTKLSNVDGLALDSTGILYAANPDSSSITEFKPLAHGNVRPYRIIVGSQTQLAYPVWVFAR